MTATLPSEIKMMEAVEALHTRFPAITTAELHEMVETVLTVALTVPQCQARNLMHNTQCTRDEHTDRRHSARLGVRSTVTWVTCQ